MGMLVARLIDFILTKKGSIPPLQEGERGEIYTFDKGPRLPNILMVTGMVLGVGVTGMLVGNTMSYVSGAIGTVIFVIGYFMKRRGMN
jgi:hypothetical protein